MLFRNSKSTSVWFYSEYNIVLFAIFLEPWDWRWPFATLKVSNTTTSNNEHGIVTRHYNQPSNEYLDLFFRYAPSL